MLLGDNSGIFHVYTTFRKGCATAFPTHFKPSTPLSTVSHSKQSLMNLDSSSNTFNLDMAQLKYKSIPPCRSASPWPPKSMKYDWMWGENIYMVAVNHCCHNRIENSTLLYFREMDHSGLFLSILI